MSDEVKAEGQEVAKQEAAAPAFDLKEILRLHAMWLKGEEGGKRADLTGANLSGAYLSGADLTHIKNDFLAAVLMLPNEVPFLRQAIVDGKIDGSTYSGECCCLAGTMAHAVGVENVQALPARGFPVQASSPREKWFTGIKPGDTPENNQVSKITLQWTDEAIAIVERIRKSASASNSNATA